LARKDGPKNFLGEGKRGLDLGLLSWNAEEKTVLGMIGTSSGVIIRDGGFKGI